MQKIVVLGPECSGKTTLCQELAAHYGTVWCPEFAREYLSSRGRKYTYDDLLNIAIGQVELEEVMEAEARNGIYFIDSDMITMQLWSEFAFNNCHTWILKQIASRQYDLHLLCKPDLPWVPDPLREYPELRIREEHYKIYKHMLQSNGGEWVEISGNGKERLQMAMYMLGINKTSFVGGVST